MTVVALIADDIWSQWDLETPRLDYTSAEDRTETIPAEDRTAAITEDTI